MKPLGMWQPDRVDLARRGLACMKEGLLTTTIDLVILVASWMHGGNFGISFFRGITFFLDPFRLS